MVKKKKTAGRPAHEPSPIQRKTVEALAGYAIPQMKIAAVIDISVPTLEKCYAKELARGGAVVEANLIANLMRIAKGTDGTALKAIMFSLQTRFGWSAYVPRPRVDDSEPLGKKATAERDALTAHEDSDWEGLVH